MLPSKPDLIILPFKAILFGLDTSLTFEQTLFLLRGRNVDTFKSSAAIPALRMRSAGRSSTALPENIVIKTNRSFASHAAIYARPMPSTMRSTTKMA